LLYLYDGKYKSELKRCHNYTGSTGGMVNVLFISVSMYTCDALYPDNQYWYCGPKPLVTGRQNN
jgi:hypothetical protein